MTCSSVPPVARSRSKLKRLQKDAKIKDGRLNMCCVLFMVECSVVNEMVCLQLILLQFSYHWGGSIDQSSQKALNESCKLPLKLKEN